MKVIKTCVCCGTTRNLQPIAIDDVYICSHCKKEAIYYEEGRIWVTKDLIRLWEGI